MSLPLIDGIARVCDSCPSVFINAVISAFPPHCVVDAFAFQRGGI